MQSAARSSCAATTSASVTAASAAVSPAPASQAVRLALSPSSSTGPLPWGVVFTKPRSTAELSHGSEGAAPVFVPLAVLALVPVLVSMTGTYLTAAVCAIPGIIC